MGKNNNTMNNHDLKNGNKITTKVSKLKRKIKSKSGCQTTLIIKKEVFYFSMWLIFYPRLDKPKVTLMSNWSMIVFFESMYAYSFAL